MGTPQVPSTDPMSEFNWNKQVVSCQCPETSTSVSPNKCRVGTQLVVWPLESISISPVWIEPLYFVSPRKKISVEHAFFPVCPLERNNLSTSGILLVICFLLQVLHHNTKLDNFNYAFVIHLFYI